MNIKVLFATLLFSISFSLGANEASLADSDSSQNKQEYTDAAADANKAIIDLFTQFVKEVDEIQFSDSGKISQIRDNTRLTAENTQKGKGEKSLAFPISVMALLVALITLFYTYNTYKSQKQTEKNTIPKANKKIQRFLLNDLIIKLFDSHLRLTALWYLLNEKKYQFYPSEPILRKSKIPADIIFTYLFYEDDKKENNNDQSNYITVQGFSEMLKDYNISIDELETHLKDKDTPPELIYREFHYILDRNDTIAKTWGKIMTILFNYDDKVKSMVFELLLDTLSSDQERSEELSNDRKYYKPNEVYSDYLTRDSHKSQMLALMEERTSVFHAEFENYLIERK